MAEGDGAGPNNDGAGGAKPTGGDGGGAAPTAPSVEEAQKLLDAFKEAGIENPTGALDTIKKLRDYERGDKLPAAVAKELDDLRKAAKTAEDAKLTADQARDKRIADLEAELEASKNAAANAAIDTAIVSASRKAGAIDPDAMPALIDKSAIEKDAKGEPTNLDKLLADAKKSKPMWFSKAPSFDGGARGNGKGDGATDMNALIRQKAGR